MAKTRTVSWRHAAVVSFLLTAANAVATTRIFLLDGLLNSSAVLFNLPRDPPYSYFAPGMFALLVIAVYRRRADLVIALQAGLLVVGYFHLVWLIGDGPDEKWDPRFILAGLLAHAVTWSSAIGFVGSLFLGVLERGWPKETSADSSA